MKKFKALLSVILAAAVLVCSAIPAFAVTEGETATADEETTVTEEITIDEAMKQLNELYSYLDYCYNATGRTFGNGPFLGYSNLLTLHDPVIYAEELYDQYLLDMHFKGTTSITVDETMAQYNKLIELRDNLTLDSLELEYLIEFCSWETNENNYYPEDLWNKFQSALTEAKTTEFATDKEMTEAFWKLYFAYNELCAVNQTPGDVNFDGKVNVLDATELQLAVAEITTLNSSQRMVAENKVSKEINITAVTNLQFVIAELSEPFACSSLKILNENFYDKGLAVKKVNRVAYLNFEKVGEIKQGII